MSNGKLHLKATPLTTVKGPPTTVPMVRSVAELIPALLAAFKMNAAHTAAVEPYIQPRLEGAVD